MFLDFVFIYVRVLVSENILVINFIEIIDFIGVSLISDVDDIIKCFNIGMGVCEIFCNIFI